MSKLLKVLIAILVLIAITVLAYLSYDKVGEGNSNEASTVVNTENLKESKVIDLLDVELVEEEEISNLEAEKVRAHLLDVNEGSLTDEELAGLYYMEEEEKLAHDIYVALGEMWGIKSFVNISRAEASHTASTVAILEAYGYESKQSPKLGVFNNSELQELYNALLDDASVSSQEALAVGGMVEEVDIVDLDKFLAETENADIINLYTNLKRGSENHLRAFVRNYERGGETYFPQFLEQEYFNSVINR